MDEQRGVGARGAHVVDAGRGPQVRDHGPATRARGHQGQALPVPTDDDQVPTGAGQPIGHGRTDPRGGAGDDGEATVPVAAPHAAPPTTVSAVRSRCGSVAYSGTSPGSAVIPTHVLRPQCRAPTARPTPSASGSTG